MLRDTETTETQTEHHTPVS